LLASLPAQAAATPAFLPLRDVAVDYSVVAPGQPAMQYRLIYDAAGQLARVEDPMRGIYALVNLPAGQAELVVPALHSTVTAPDIAGLAQEVSSADHARFTPLGHGTVAGLACETYLVLDNQGTATACITADGVTLRFHGQDAHGSATVTATSVAYQTAAPAEFAAPDGFGSISLPPGAIAQLLGQP
jgi:YD repeat-containing protein